MTTDVTPRPRLAWIDPLVCGAIFAAGYALIDGWPRSFSDAGTRIAVSAPAAAVLAAVAAVAAATRVRLVSALATLLAIAACVLPTAWPMHDSGRWPAATLALVAAGLIAAFVIVAGLLNDLRDARGERLVTMLLLLGMTGATLGLLVFDGSARTMQRTLPLLAALVVALVVGAIWRRRLASDGVVAFAVAGLAGQLVTGWLWTDMPLWHAACVAAAPLVAWLARFGLGRVRRDWLRVPLIVLVAALPAIVACAIAGTKYYHEWQSTGAGGADDAAQYGY